MSPDKNKKSLTVYLGPAKALDTVIHPKLIEILNISLRGTLLNLFDSYLFDRTQHIMLSI